MAAHLLNARSIFVRRCKNAMFDVAKANGCALYSSKKRERHPDFMMDVMINGRNDWNDLLKSMYDPPPLEYPPFIPYRTIKNKGTDTNLELILFQKQWDPLCGAVRAYLEYRGISYRIAEVDLLRLRLRWFHDTQVPIVLVKTETYYVPVNGHEQIILLLDSYLTSTYWREMEYDETKSKIHFFTLHFQIPANEPKLTEEWKRVKWCGKVLAPLISANVYRNYSEAREAFKWFAERGEWFQVYYFDTLTKLIIKVGPIVMWLTHKLLKRKHPVKDVRQSLYDECNNWMKDLEQKNTPYMGGETPDWADIVVYGALNSVEGCTAFADVKNHTKLQVWYDKMAEQVSKHKGSVNPVILCPKRKETKRPLM